MSDGLSPFTRSFAFAASVKEPRPYLNGTGAARWCDSALQQQRLDSLKNSRNIIVRRPKFKIKVSKLGWLF